MERGTSPLSTSSRSVLDLTSRSPPAVYQACELATDGREDSVAAFMSRFFKLGIRVLCSPPPPTAHADSAPFSSLGGPAAGMTAPLHPPVVPAPPTSAALAVPALPSAPVRPALRLERAERRLTPHRALAAYACRHRRLFSSARRQLHVLRGHGRRPALLVRPSSLCPSLVRRRRARLTRSHLARRESLFPGQATDWSWLDSKPGEEMLGVALQ